MVVLTLFQKGDTMMKKGIRYIGLMMCAAILLVGGCAALQEKTPAKPTTKAPTQADFKKPTVSLSHVEVAHYWGWWYYAKKVEPTKGDPGDYGAPLDLAFILNIENPNTFPIKLESLKFTIAFEEFDLNSVSAMETQWIPPGKTNQIRVHGMFDGRQSMLSLMATGGFKLKEKNLSAFDQLEKWWKGIPEFAFPIHVKEGAAIFSAEGGLTQVVSFTATFP